MKNSKLTPTKGEWRVTCSTTMRFPYDYKVSDTQESDEEMESNRKLISDAGNTFTETGLTPSELLLQRNELLESLILITKQIGFEPEEEYGIKALSVINKISK